MNAADDFSPARVADRLAIEHTLHRWCRAVDRLDFDGIADVFHPDAIDSHGPYDGDVPGLIAWIRERHRGIPFSMHAVSNLLIEFAGPDLALAESYVRTTQRYPVDQLGALAQLAGTAGPGGHAMDLMTCSRYVDRFERRGGGGWKILRRTLVADWKSVTPVLVDVPPPPAGWAAGRRDQDDTVF